MPRKNHINATGFAAAMIAILDCGSQFTHNIARRVRELNVYCEIFPYNKKIHGADGIIVSGSPACVHDRGAPFFSKDIFSLGVPVLGICYGMQSIAHLLGGRVEKSVRREYGPMQVLTAKSPLFRGLPRSFQAWMSHGDRVLRLPPGYSNIASTGNSRNAAMQNLQQRVFAVQFHPEVDHTEHGRKVISNFIDICGCKRDWTPKAFIEDTVEGIRAKVGKGMAIGGVSGGVDSAVAARLMHMAIGERFLPVLVDHGLCRKDECRQVQQMLGRHIGGLLLVDAHRRFLSALKGVSDPEEKRRIIGREFIAAFESEAKKHRALKYLMQGTLYPDVIESVSVFGGPTSTIKSHHNVGGLPRRMKLGLVEPLRFLFKDEVRKVGVELGLPGELLWRHPFPGPGLAVRIIGEVTARKLSLLREADSIFIEELKKSGYYSRVWQALAVLTKGRSVGVMGDERTYGYTVALRAVTSKDGMTAGWAKLPHRLLEKVSARIVNEIEGINRVVYDITTKPPGTIEWE